MAGGWAGRCFEVAEVAADSIFGPVTQDSNAPETARLTYVTARFLGPAQKPTKKGNMAA